MGTLRTLIITFLLVFILADTSSQGIVRQSINSFGKTVVVDGYRISETVGQPYITKTDQQGSVVFQPGFQQQIISGKKQLVFNTQQLLIELYPNPASSELWVMPSKVIQDVVITVIDMNGKVIAETIHNELYETSLDVSAWPAGLYAIRINHSNAHETISERILIIK